jgi:hypothetical protein
MAFRNSSGIRKQRKGHLFSKQKEVSATLMPRGDLNTLALYT